MKNDKDAQFLCKDCVRFNQCQYYDRRKGDSYICKYFHLSAGNIAAGAYEKGWEQGREALIDDLREEIRKNLSDNAFIHVPYLLSIFTNMDKTESEDQNGNNAK